MEQTQTGPGGTVALAPDETVTRNQNEGLARLANKGLPRQRSLWSDAFRRMAKNKLAIIGLFVVSLFTLTAIFAPWIAPYGQSEVVDPRLARTGPSWTWPMGLDQNGRDIFSRLVWGARVSLTVGLVAQTIVIIIGVTVGALAGYFAGKTDTFLMRFVDVVYAIPQILLVMIFLNLFGPGLQNIFIAIGLVAWVTEARLLRSQFLSLRESEYVSAARISGAGPRRIIGRHMLPNSLTPLIVAATFGVPTAIFTEASLSYVGVGIMPPQASWGQMVGDASVAGYIQTAPHMLIFPVLAVGLTMLGFTFLGDGLRDALDVRGER
ncbi:MAG TPA: ABC transporter permease [Thermomicrobiales bacterium]|jgi:ABC-type dipeptide/oligopeptide/nickel transport system permease subunit|nr:ABC transporter permease [Thermomicrobiales bacterium]